MKIAAVIVTHNRIELLPRALHSIKNQRRQPDSLYIISNSTEENYCLEKKICADFGYSLLQNQRTPNYAGALNTSIEEIVKEYGISDDCYFASLDDDDEWLPAYLHEIEQINTEQFDLIASEIQCVNETENHLLELPDVLLESNFLIGNPGIHGSNTFIKLKTLLKAGTFDEELNATTDRDLLVRVFLQKPTYKVIHKNLVIQYIEKERERLTTNTTVKKKSLRQFYRKYNHLLKEEEKEGFFLRAEQLFFVDRNEFFIGEEHSISFSTLDLNFDGKGNYQFVIGFISDNDQKATRIVNQLIQKQIPVDFIVIIDNSPKLETLGNTEKLLQQSKIPCKIVTYNEWNKNLANGYYGEFFEKYTDINSIPLGRTILHKHLFEETTPYEKPIFWIIDDDIEFSATTSDTHSFQLFELINESINSTDAIIGGISKDPPIPALSCIRTQLVDFIYSYGRSATESLNKIYSKPDYYYDLSDLHTNHLETPIYKSGINESHLHQIFSGKAIFRPALQRELQSENKLITRRGANTIVLNREVLQLYPVINLQVNNKLARRGDLTWALFNQILSNKNMIEHTFCINHDRPLTTFDLEKELDKSAYDIIGFAFNKALFSVIEKIKENERTLNSADIFKLLSEDYFNELMNTYEYYLTKRKVRFMMNYFRIIGLTELIIDKFGIGQAYCEVLSDESKIFFFEKAIDTARSPLHLKSFLKDLNLIIEQTLPSK